MPTTMETLLEEIVYSAKNGVSQKIWFYVYFFCLKKVSWGYRARFGRLADGKFTLKMAKLLDTTRLE